MSNSVAKDHHDESGRDRTEGDHVCVDAGDDRLIRRDKEKS